MLIRRYWCFLIMCCFSVLGMKAQKVAVKTNALYWMTASLNAELEVKLADRYTAGVLGAYNPWAFKNEKYMKFWAVQPEFRYWFCEAFEGHFVGAHAHAAQYYGGFSDKRYDGYLAGGGLTYGYNWLLSPHWNVEAAVGAGYARLWYKESPKVPCVKCFGEKHGNYWGITKVAVTFSYIF